jgi:hypothetical protein
MKRRKMTQLNKTITKQDGEILHNRYEPDFSRQPLVDEQTRRRNKVVDKILNLLKGEQE